MARVVEDEDVTCTKSGQVCKNCQEVYYCISLPGGKWISEPMYECSPKTPCLASIGNCSSLANSECEAAASGYNFKCYQTGIFPDPYDCTAYHMCTPQNPTGIGETKLKCDPGFAYNSLTAKCSIPIINGNCSTISPPCNTLGETGPDPQNPSLYYVCLTVRDPVATTSTTLPAIFSCPNDQVFDGVSACKNSTTTITEPTLDYGLTADGNCKTLGYFPVMNDCIGFNNCYIVNYPPQRRNCVYKMYFDPKKQLCVDFKCSDLN